MGKCDKTEDVLLLYLQGQLPGQNYGKHSQGLAALHLFFMLFYLFVLCNEFETPAIILPVLLDKCNGINNKKQNCKCRYVHPRINFIVEIIAGSKQKVIYLSAMLLLVYTSGAAQG